MARPLGPRGRDLRRQHGDDRRSNGRPRVVPPVPLLVRLRVPGGILASAPRRHGAFAPRDSGGLGLGAR